MADADFYLRELATTRHELDAAEAELAQLKQQWKESDLYAEIARVTEQRKDMRAKLDALEQRIVREYQGELFEAAEDMRELVASGRAEMRATVIAP